MTILLQKKKLGEVSPSTLTAIEAAISVVNDENRKPGHCQSSCQLITNKASENV
jgi:hypothetical protein